MKTQGTFPANRVAQAAQDAIDAIHKDRKEEISKIVKKHNKVTKFNWKKFKVETHTLTYDQTITKLEKLGFTESFEYYLAKNMHDVQLQTAEILLDMANCQPKNGTLTLSSADFYQIAPYYKLLCDRKPKSRARKQ